MRDFIKLTLTTTTTTTNGVKPDKSVGPKLKLTSNRISTFFDQTNRLFYLSLLSASVMT